MVQNNIIHNNYYHTIRLWVYTGTVISRYTILFEYESVDVIIIFVFHTHTIWLFYPCEIANITVNRDIYV